MKNTKENRDDVLRILLEGMSGLEYEAVIYAHLHVLWAAREALFYEAAAAAAFELGSEDGETGTPSRSTHTSYIHGYEAGHVARMESAEEQSMEWAEGARLDRKDVDYSGPSEAAIHKD